MRALKDSIQCLAITLYHLLTGNRRIKAAPDASFLLQARSVRGGLAQICKNTHWPSQSEPIRDISWYQMADPLAYGHLVQYVSTSPVPVQADLKYRFRQQHYEAREGYPVS